MSADVADLGAGITRDARRFLRVFGGIVALWVTLLALTAPVVERPTILWSGVALAWLWAGIAWPLVDRRPWVFGGGWLAVAVVLELLGPASGTDGWSVAGGSALLVIAAAALSQRRVVLVAVVATLSVAVLGRGIFASEHTLGASLGTLVLFAFSAVSVWWLVRTVRDGEQERQQLRDDLARTEAERAVAQERAESAARLHDSVLQSLAAIHRVEEIDSAREHAGRASSEMRAWIRDRTAQAAMHGSLREVLEAAVVEAGAGRVGFSSSGDVPDPAHLRPLVDAGSEAVRNAVRHTQGPIRVFLECRGDAATVWIADHGPGFDLEHVADDRHGVRGSIVERLQRAGGSATLRSSDEGSEWELRLPIRPVA